MKPLKDISVLILFVSLISGCTSAQKLQTKAPIDYKDVYFQKWVAGIQGGGSGNNLFIPISNETTKNIQLDSVYFRGKGVLLEKIKGENTLYVGRFITNDNQKNEVIMSSDSNEEYGNQAPLLEEKFPFELKDSECVVSYKEGKITNYFKITNIIEKQPQYYPSAANKQQ